MSHEIDPLLTYRELRQKLRCSQTTAETLARTGAIPSVPVGEPGSRKPRRLFRTSDVDAYIARNVTRTTERPPKPVGAP